MAKCGPRVLIMSCGRRYDLVSSFETALNEVGGELFALDIVDLAPGLYGAKQHVVIPKDLSDPRCYMEDVLELCERKGITAVLTLIDPEMSLLAEYRDRFEAIGVTLVLSSNGVVQQTYDKQLFYETYQDILPLALTYPSKTLTIKAIDAGNAKLPMIAKPRFGSGSAGLTKIHYQNEFPTLKFCQTLQFVFQEEQVGPEFGIDAYFDLISGRLVSIFMKEKLAMRSGETDRAVSVFDEEILASVQQLEGKGFHGPLDIDIFRTAEGVVVNEINPRFGGGYSMASCCGIDFIQLLLTNLDGKENPPVIGGYPCGVKMMKFPTILVQPDS